MSRETDSSPSGPQGRGGSAYPSGTPPYGSRQAPGLQQDATEESGAQAAARKGEPRTETTLTTRIRINIPGSRPIPPVVVRTPVADGTEATDGRGLAALAGDGGGGGDEGTGSTPAPGTPAPPAQSRQEPSGEPAPQPGKKKKTSDWFAPRKPMSAGGTMGAGLAASEAAGASGAGTPGPGTPDAGTPGTGSPSGDATRDGGTSPYGDAAYQDPFRADAFREEVRPPAGTDVPPFGASPTSGAAEHPNGPTAGPATGGSGLGALADDPLGQSGPGVGLPTGPGHTPPYGTPEVGGPGPRSTVDGTPGHGTPATPAHGTPARGGAPGVDGPPRMSDDTAILTPQQFVPEPGTPGAGQSGGNVSGSTLSSGIRAGSPDGPTAPFPTSARPDSAAGRPRVDLTPRLDGRGAPGQGPGGPGAGPGGPGGPTPSAAAAPPAAAAPARPAAKKKGRSKLVLAVVAVLVVGGGLYGAGLVMSHADVPKGTTVLGVAIGGSTKDQAVDKLEGQFGKRATMPLKLTVDGKSKALSPQNAGLTLDDQATVEAASGPDYNPVDVIGSLFGRPRPVEPVMPLDDEKLTAALSGMTQSLGSAREGTITFDTGEPVKVAGRAGTGLDVARAKQSVRDAYRNQVETGRAVGVTLPTVEQQPTISQAEIDRAMKDFAEPAMSDLVTIKSGNAAIQFGKVSLPKILSMKAVNGKLVDSYDLKALKSAYGSAFDGVTVKRADGSSTAVTPQDVADQLRVALRGKTPDERVREIGAKTDGLTG